MQTETRYCLACGDETTFETPLCVEGHGEDCPDRLCSRCGAAAFAMDWAQWSQRTAA